NQLAAERGVSPESIIEGVKQALAAAYRKDHGVPVPELEEGKEPKDDVEVQLNLETGEARIFKEKKDVTPAGFGRIAAQTAKQVILQKIREEEKEAIRTEFKEKEKSIVSGSVFRVDNGVVFVDLGRTQGILPPSEQIASEQYHPGARVKAMVKEVQEGARGPEILLSRTDPEFVTELFALEVPEISQGVVKVEVIAREAGRRTKMAVSSSEERVDPVGSCVGQKGVRVQAVTHELGEEKVDIIPYSADESTFVASALSPAKVLKVKIKPKSRTAEVEVPEDQLSLAIGKEGQNVRLAAKLTGWRIDIKGAGAIFAAGTKGLGLVEQGLSPRVAKILGEAGVDNLEKLRVISSQELAEIKGLGPKARGEIEKVIGEAGSGEKPA
ncbi:MAG: transcription termination factor NusA, partial [candidate division WWE3 bacterium]|nr:transcription termination factor NusA [candidate division WWE3 bacterium]